VRRVSIVQYFLLWWQDTRRSSEPLTRTDCPLPSAVAHSLNEAIHTEEKDATTCFVFGYHPPTLVLVAGKRLVVFARNDWANV
jgi:hypothetical protein